MLLPPVGAAHHGALDAPFLTRMTLKMALVTLFAEEAAASLLILVFLGEFAEKATESAVASVHPGKMDRCWCDEDLFVYHVSELRREAEQR